MSEQVEQHILKRYNLIKKLGSGAYGHVWKVTDKKTGQTLALKKIFDAFQHSTDAQRTFREIVFLHQLNHPNIIKLHQVIRAENDKDLYLVFEFMQADLHNAIGQKILKDIHNRFIIYQVVKGIKFLHSAQVIHRDLKPSNVLLNSDCHLKICDFGLARSLVADKQGTDMILTQQVATRWYRAPQVLLGSQTYQKSADIWSVGCILGQMLIGKPMFPGNSTLNQLQRIVSFTGNPSKQDIYSLNSQVAISMMSSITQFKIKNIKDWFKSDTPSQAIDLITHMLQFNPKKRLTAQQILKHPYLTQFHNVKQQYQSPKIIYPPVSDNKKLNLKQYRQLIYQRIKKIYRNQDNQPSTQQNISSNSFSNSFSNSNNTNNTTTNSNTVQHHKISSHSINNNNTRHQQHQHEHKSINKQQNYNTYNLHNNNNNNQDKQDGSYTPIRHSTGKMKTTSYTSSCSSFTQFQNNINGNSNVNGNGNNGIHNSIHHGQSHHNNSTNNINTYNNFYNNNPINNNNINNSQDLQQYNKIHKKSSLKQILKNKKYKQQTPKIQPSTNTSSTMPQNYVQKYYKKPGMSATIYKQNKLNKHI